MNKIFVFLLFTAFLSSGCSLDSTTQQATEGRPATGPVQTQSPQFRVTAAPTGDRPPAAQTPLPTSEPLPQAGVTPGPASVFSACPIQDQSAAMQVDHLPDWEALGLSTCYDLALDLEVDRNAYHGGAAITYANLTGAPLTDLVLRTYPNAERIYGGELTITAATVNGDPVDPEVFLPDGTAARLPLPTPLPAGESAQIELEFTGRYSRNFGAFGVYGVFNYVSAEQVLTLANWYPLLAPWREGGWDVDPVIGIGDAVVSETSLFSVQVTAPAGWQVVTTGSLASQEQGDAATNWHFVSGPVRDFTILASPNFVLRRAQSKGVTIRHWGLADGQDRWDEALQATVDGVTLFEERFGPYPYAELDVVAAPLQIAAGVEYPGLFIIAASQYQPDPESPFLLGIVVSHETAHQWWYGLVGNDVVADPWQDEALATFSSLLYQQVYQPGIYPGTLRFYQDRVADLEAGSIDTDIDQPLSEFRNRPNQYSPVVYIRGALFFVELRENLGDQVFFNALGSYYAENKYRIAAPADLLSAFESACSCELDEFYAEWGIGD